MNVIAKVTLSLPLKSARV